MSPGTAYEVFVQDLQQAILDAEEVIKQKNIRIERNKIITDNLGINREFDLYWEYELGGLTYKTVIECKDYTSKISVDKIDALIGKMRDIPDLKAVFATKTGYQSGAKIKAEGNKIDLLIVREQRDDDWQDKDGNPLINKVEIDIHYLPSVRITHFRSYIDRKWLTEHTQFNEQDLDFSGRMNNAIFIEDENKSETYSLLELANRLDSLCATEYGDLSYSESFENAYFLFENFRLKLTSFELRYTRSPPLVTTARVDFSRSLIGVIEYLNRNSSTAIFSDLVIKDWNG